ncbi:formylglycine-generating enzyme family protein [Chromobacterium haemolyticum]|uniref:formylglycine-generating enzyme family protein n=1 Tax=Chromobacterium haemolyticum TaxID=394935 RepID=UPI001316C3F1|nr:SUMF1/EgtB/PvdO family nonheme iron enzyme [Chromobacterium haemolyticum]BBH12939.1 hypothetical protein CH06BL_21870 [Chromobacterium haemolyticum]
MPDLTRLTFVSLDGDTPPSESVDRLPEAAKVLSVVRGAFEGFFGGPPEEAVWDGIGDIAAPDSGLHLVYVYGHAWLVGTEVETAWMAEGRSVASRGADALKRWITSTASERTILILDCCHAAAFNVGTVEQHVPLFVVFASAETESAIALPTDGASRLSLAFAEELSRAEKVDLARAVANIAERLDKDGVIRGQTVSYRMAGPAVRLSRSSLNQVVHRERAVSRLRNRLVAAGAVVAFLLVASGWYYWSHVIVEIDLAGLPDIAHNVVVVASAEEPNSNSSSKIAEQSANGGNSVRVWVPADNVILRVHANYADGVERALSFHLNLLRSFDARGKLVSLSLPPAADVQMHPGMAFIPAVSWFHGSKREAQRSNHAFWIDLTPPTVSAYETVARRMLATGTLKIENSFILSSHERSTALDATGLGQVRNLSMSLGNIFEVIAATNSPYVEAPADIVVGAGTLPCKECPAPMTHLEASLYCEARHMRLPTDLEWELAVRGVDGRTYPWGNRFDASKANVPGPPEKGGPPPALKPVDAYKTERSPFGLWDTVGNAGDWVTNMSGSYKHYYMGATYQFNQEDATAFQMRPVTDEDSIVREITARCVVEDS